MKMGAEEMTWRKLPRNIITDPVMDYIASRLPTEYSSAPYMFYMVAMSIADDDGIFDLEDGIIFSRLMHIGDPSLVAQIANLMLERKIIVRAGKTTKCMITNWGYSKNGPTRTIEERREVVRRKMLEEQQARSEQFNKLEQQPVEVADEEIIPVDFSKNPTSESFLCPNDDKNEKNVVKKNQTEKKREEREDSEKNTHTEEDKTREIEKQQLQASGEKPYAAAEEEIKQESSDKSTEGTEIPTQDVSDLAAQALSVGGSVSDEEEKTWLFNILVEFFTKNCLGFNASHYKMELDNILRRIMALADENNPPNIVAATLLGQFKKLTEDEGYYHHYPLTPNCLIKFGIWEHTIAATSKILLTNKNKKPKWVKQLEEIDEGDREQVGDALKAQYLEYNIDPEDPKRIELLLKAKTEKETRSSSP